jgi:hypothetical protein
LLRISTSLVEFDYAAPLLSLGGTAVRAAQNAARSSRRVARLSRRQRLTEASALDIGLDQQTPVARASSFD